MGPPDSGESYLKHSASNGRMFSFAELLWGQWLHPKALDSAAC